MNNNMLLTELGMKVMPRRICLTFKKLEDIFNTKKLQNESKTLNKVRERNDYRRTPRPLIAIHNSKFLFFQIESSIRHF